jgi:hypothetical protein
MTNRQYREHQQRCKEHLEATEHAYVFRPKSGLYEPKTTHPENESDYVTAGTSPNSPLFVNARTDWGPHVVAWIIGILTLLIIAYYTYVTHGIFDTSQVGTVGTIEAAKAARDAADIANATLKSSQQQFRNEQRPYVWVQVGTQLSVANPTSNTALPDLMKQNIPLVVNIVAINGGRSPATGTVFSELSLIFDTLASARQKVREYKPTYSAIGSVLMPNSSASYFHSTTAFGITPEILRDLSNGGGKAMFVLGALQYRDIFSPTIPAYESRFCFSVHPYGLPFGDCGELGQTWIK